MSSIRSRTSLYDLRKWGHIDWERRSDPRHKGRRLLHYTLPVTRWTEEDITQAVYARAAGESTCPDGDPECPPQRTRVPAPTGTPKQSTRPDVEKSTRPGVCSNLKSNLEDNTAVPSEPADRTKPSSKKTKRRSQIASDWQPPTEAMAWVRSQYVANDRQIAEQVEQFRNHHQGKGSRMADWTARGARGGATATTSIRVESPAGRPLVRPIRTPMPRPYVG